MEWSLFPLVKNRQFTPLTRRNETQRGLKPSLQACGMKHLVQWTVNDTSWSGVVHALSKEYQFTHFQRHHWTRKKMKASFWISFITSMCGDQHTFAIYIQCIIHIDVVLKVSVLAKTHLWSNLFSKVFIIQKEYYLWTSPFESHWPRQKNKHKETLNANVWVFKPSWL